MRLFEKCVFVQYMVFLCSISFAQEITFRHVVVDTQGPVDPWGKGIGDLNGDQKVDLIVGGSSSGGLVWYQNPTWEKHTIADRDQWSTDHEVADVDQDGDIDVVSLTKTAVYWYENPSWNQHLIDRRVLHDIELADLDDDGDIDLFGANHKGRIVDLWVNDSLQAKSSGRAP